MPFIQPYVRHMLLCDEVIIEHNKISIINLIHSLKGDHVPFVIPQLSIYLSLTGGRGQAEVTVAGTHADSGQRVFKSPVHSVSFNPDPLQVQGLVVRVAQVPIPKPGLYWIECYMNDEVIAQQTLLFR